ncbi:MAG: ral secretion pathway protein [Aliidongia sp.]|jgi:DNA uptake protein ComE-like DNA-binding protein|nr:ral secretion pathway protein [Aliidongia sp.]
MTRPPGFILAATLWIVAILALIAAYITGWVGDSLNHGYVRLAKVEAFRKSEEARATALYWFSTRFISFRGIELLSGADLTIAGARDPFSAPTQGKTYLALDDRPYRLGSTMVHLQDQRGLLNTNTGADADWYRLLGNYGVRAEDRGPMIAKLHDYDEPGPYKRLNGAKAKEYEAAGKPPPTGEKLRTPWELRRVLDWDKVDPAGFSRSGLYEQVTTVTTAGLNLNTAPPAILALLPNVSDAAVARIVAARQKQPLRSAAEAAAAGNVAISDESLRYYFLPLNSLRISIMAPDNPLERVMGVHLTPSGAEQPWQIDYIFDIPPFPDHSLRDGIDILDLPDPTHPPAPSGRG